MQDEKGSEPTIQYIGSVIAEFKSHNMGKQGSWQLPRSIGSVQSLWGGIPAPVSYLGLLGVDPLAKAGGTSPVLPAAASDHPFQEGLVCHSREAVMSSQNYRSWPSRVFLVLGR